MLFALEISLIISFNTIQTYLITYVARVVSHSSSSSRARNKHTQSDNDDDEKDDENKSNLSRYYQWITISESLGSLLLILFGLLLEYLGFGAVMIIFSFALFAMIPFVFYNTHPKLLIVVTPDSKSSAKKGQMSDDNWYHNVKYILSDLNLCIALMNGTIGALKKNGLTVLITYLFSLHFGLGSSNNPFGFISILVISFIALNLGAMLPAFKCFQRFLIQPHFCFIPKAESDNREYEKRRIMVSNLMMICLLSTVFENVLFGTVALIWNEFDIVRENVQIFLFALIFSFVAHFINGFTQVLYRTKTIHFIGINRPQIQSEFMGFQSVCGFIGGMVGLQLCSKLFQTFGLQIVFYYYAILTLISTFFGFVLWLRISRFAILK